MQSLKRLFAGENWSLRLEGRRVGSGGKFTGMWGQNPQLYLYLAKFYPSIIAVQQDYYKPTGLKQHKSIVSWLLCQKVGHESARFSASGSHKLQARCQLGLLAISSEALGKDLVLRSCGC